MPFASEIHILSTYRRSNDWLELRIQALALVREEPEGQCAAKGPNQESVQMGELNALFIRTRNQQ